VAIWPSHAHLAIYLGDANTTPRFPSLAPFRLRTIPRWIVVRALARLLGRQLAHEFLLSSPDNNAPTDANHYTPSTKTAPMSPPAANLLDNALPPGGKMRPRKS